MIMERPKRSKRSYKEVEESDPEGETRTSKFQWSDYVSEEVLARLGKLPVPTSVYTVLSDPTSEYSALLRDWHYQYVIAWFYNTCESSVTLNYYDDDADNAHLKSMWRDIQFDELLLLDELINSRNNYNVDDDDALTLFQALRLHLLKQLTNNKSVLLEGWDTATKHYLMAKEEDPKQFDELSIQEKFTTLYSIIKIIETKNLAFRNYILNEHVLQLFEFPELILETSLAKDSVSTSLIVLPNLGVLIEKTTKRSSLQDDLAIPLELKNCTIKYENPSIPQIELIHLDYSQDIDNYLKSFHTDYKVLTTGWASFIEYLTKLHDNPENEESLEVFDFLSQYIQVYAEHQVSARKLLIQKDKERTMNEMLTRRKRSSRLVAREEETKRKEVEISWFEKIDEREHFIKSRHKITTKQVKKVKDILWNRLWLAFEQDLKTEKLQRRNQDLEQEAIATEEAITILDKTVIEHGPHFNEKLIDCEQTSAAPMENSKVNQYIDLPKEYCITQEDLDLLANYGIDADGEIPDEKSWIFQCPGEKDLGTVIVHNDDEVDQLMINRPLIRCEHCFKWQHWDCQAEQTAEILSLAESSREYHVLTQKDFGTVLLGQSHGSRRSVRIKQHEDSVPLEEDFQLRPVDKMKPLNESATFICQLCLVGFEKELRNIFVPELRNIRAKQKKQIEDRQKRKKLKEEKKRLQSEKQHRQLQYNHNDNQENTAFGVESPSSIVSTPTPSVSLPVNQYTLLDGSGNSATSLNSTLGNDNMAQNNNGISSTQQDGANTILQENVNRIL